ncbi:neutral amino acid permease, putative [Paecilomyces variotii No. 5]|uniref:Neutral amino acid permease, putative n=1 Tax=Byssochlamys spectabilis (strain No. 5 / NBRC 109023) TaxID=1356009 RepID=V5I1F6_BYSSN|nr:neutral amino acid permease, putative [Paecilomyces variotii No. 5]
MISFMGSMPRTFRGLARLGAISAFFTLISILLVVIFAGIETHPYGWSEKDGNPTVLIIPAEGTKFVTGLSAFLNISFTFIGQITLPSLIAEMEEPKDFWKSVTLVTVCEIILFSTVGALVYAFIGDQYISSMAIGSLRNDLHMKISFSFMVPTLIFLGVLYASVSARFIFFRLFANTRHVGSHTAVGWASWAGILLILWILAWVIAEVIPFFSDLLSIMGAVFGSFFGFIFWGVANLHMRKVHHGSMINKKMGILGWLDLLFNITIVFIGLFFLGPGTYVSSYLSPQSGTVADDLNLRH